MLLLLGTGDGVLVCWIISTRRNREGAGGGGGGRMDEGRVVGARTVDGGGGAGGEKKESKEMSSIVFLSLLSSDGESPSDPVLIKEVGGKGRDIRDGTESAVVASCSSSIPKGSKTSMRLAVVFFVFSLLCCFIDSPKSSPSNTSSSMLTFTVFPSSFIRAAADAVLRLGASFLGTAILLGRVGGVGSPKKASSASASKGVFDGEDDDERSREVDRSESSGELGREDAAGLLPNRPRKRPIALDPRSGEEVEEGIVGEEEEAMMGSGRAEGDERSTESIDGMSGVG